MTNAPSVSVTNLRFGFGGQIVLDQLTFELTAGIYWLQGPNGAGKSTLLKLLARSLDPLGGEIALCGLALVRMTADQRQAIFLCDDELPNLPWLRGLELVGLYAALYPKIDRIALHMHFDRMAITHSILHSPIMNLSLGERKKIQLAVALSVDVVLLLMDEPFNAIDEGAAKYVRADLENRGAQNKQIVVMTSHTNPEMSFSPRKLVLQGGSNSTLVTNHNAGGPRQPDSVELMVNNVGSCSPNCHAI